MWTKKREALAVMAKTWNAGEPRGVRAKTEPKVVKQNQTGLNKANWSNVCAKPQTVSAP